MCPNISLNIETCLYSLTVVSPVIFPIVAKMGNISTACATGGLLKSDYVIREIYIWPRRHSKDSKNILSPISRVVGHPRAMQIRILVRRWSSVASFFSLLFSLSSMIFRICLLLPM